MGSFPIILVFAVAASSVSATLYTQQSVMKGKSASKDVIYIRGKYFYKNGTAASSASALASTPSQNFQQCLDQNDSRCSRKWNQRYWVNRNYYQRGGPVFFMLGAEGDAEGSVDQYRWLWYARQYGAILVCLEHRFYGKSIPTRDNSLQSLKLLTSGQALADGARFIRWFKQQNQLTNVKTVVFGGSYGGNLAAWFRQKYPKDANIAVASSGPLLAKFDMFEYMQKVSEVIFWNNQDCFDAIYQAFNCMEDIVYGRNTGCSQITDKSQLPQAVHMCYNVNFDNEIEKQYFFNTLAMGTWASNYPGTENTPKCNSLLSHTNSNQDIIAAYGDFLQDQGSAGQCDQSVDSEGSFNITSKTQEVLDFINSDAGVLSGAAGWFWQTCYEFGYYMTADPKYQIFGRDFGTMVYVAQCQQQYGSTFTSQYIQTQISQTNNYYKDKKYDGTCTIFVNGAWDPWSTLGITSSGDTSSKNYVIHIPKAEHCEDMVSTRKPDTVKAQQEIQDQIGRYLSDSSC